MTDEERKAKKRENTKRWRERHFAELRKKGADQVRKWRANNRERYAATNKRATEKWKATHPHRKFKYAYKLSEEDALRLHALADTGPCELCGETGRMHFDHNHATGKFRGLLCIRCNQGLGRFRDNADLLELAAKYIRERG